MKIALHGYGRMGCAVEAAALARGHEIGAIFDSAHPVDPAELAGADAVIDFSEAEAVDAIVDASCEAKVSLVIGTTGWSHGIDDVRARSAEAGIGVVYSSNFAPGANVAFAVARYMAEMLSSLEGWDAGIEERHHHRKKDAPSGTAIRLAEIVRSGSGQRWDPSIVSSRVGDEPGTHRLFFDSPEEVLEIVHRARSRSGFATGAVIAAERLAGRVGFFRFDELLEMRSLK